MSQHSTSKILETLATGQSKSQSEDVIDQKITDKEEVFSVPQLKPSSEPAMKEILARILGPSYSKKYTPTDKN